MSPILRVVIVSSFLILSSAFIGTNQSASISRPDQSAISSTDTFKLRPVRDIVQQCQDYNVWIKAAGYTTSGMETSGSGSGVLIQTSDGSVWVLTAGHVVDYSREMKKTTDPRTGAETVSYPLKPVTVSKWAHRDNVLVEIWSVQADIVRLSPDSPDGTSEDIAILRLREDTPSGAVVLKQLRQGGIGAKFYLDSKIPAIDTDVYHCGNLLGKEGINSVSRGHISMTGRQIFGTIFDQSTCSAYPGSSGGGVYLTDGRYIGMLTCGYGPAFNFYVPIRRIHAWSKHAGVEFIFDHELPVPSEKDLKSKPVEDKGFKKTKK